MQTVFSSFASVFNNGILDEICKSGQLQSPPIGPTIPTNSEVKVGMGHDETDFKTLEWSEEHLVWRFVFGPLVVKAPNREMIEALITMLCKISLDEWTFTKDIKTGWWTAYVC